MFLVAACCLASCARGLVAPSAPSAWGRPSRLGAAQASEDLALWDEKPDGSSTDVDLAALDDVDALYEAKRRTAAGVAFAERAGYKARDVCLAADSEALALVAYAQGFRRFSSATVGAAADLAAALPGDARFLSRAARRLPRDKRALQALGDRLVFEAARGAGAGAGSGAGSGSGAAEADGEGAPAKGERTKVSASRRRFLEKRDAERNAARAASPKKRRAVTRMLATPAALAKALDDGRPIDETLGGVLAASEDADAARDAARRLAGTRPFDTVAVAAPLARVAGLFPDAERKTLDVWPLLALDDPALDEFLPTDADDDVEFESIKLPLDASAYSAAGRRAAR